MARYNTLLASVIATSLFSLPITAVAQPGDDGCGEEPVAPAIVDGATSAMEDLVANSKAVTGFIAEADTYLDCREAYVKDKSNGLSESDRDAVSATISALTKKRNEIGDLFNAEVAKFREANPE